MSESSKTAKRREFAQHGATHAAIASDHVTYIRVDAEYAGQRLDNFLLRLAKGVPKSHVYRIVRSGEVRVNRARASVDQRLQVGDELRIPPMRIATKATKQIPHSAREYIPSVVFEDEHLMAVNKPAGLAVHGGSGVSFGLIEQLRAARPQQAFLELVHRLDRETSGILLLAKSRRALIRLHEAMRTGQVDKRYLALVAGGWLNQRQHIKAPLYKYVDATGQRWVRVDPEGQFAHTVFNRIQSFQGQEVVFTLLEAQLHTGRTHQIRVHLAHAGHPIVGDHKYGDIDLNKQVASNQFRPPLKRMFLHAYRFDVDHPIEGVPLHLEVPLTVECASFLDGLLSPEASKKEGSAGAASV